jgi:Holliday junction resolvase-like predicted endonuclease
MDCSTVGAASELEAASWLLGQGYQVFRNVSAHGPADLVAWNPQTKETLFVDVTTGRPYVRADGSLHYTLAKRKLTVHKESGFGVRVLVCVPEEHRFFWMDEQT